MLRFTERQGFHSKTLLTLATVGIMSVFLLGHSQTALIRLMSQIPLRH